MAASMAPEPVFTVAAVAAKLGVAPATLRTWDRRYGLGPSDHVEGAHRRYSNSDIARLLVMRRLTMTGVAPADAARIAVTASGEQLDAEAPASLSLVPDAGVDGAEDAITNVASERTPVSATSPQSIEPTPELLIAAAGEFDVLACLAIVQAAIDSMGPAEGWTHVISPAIDELRAQYLTGGPGEDAAVLAAAVAHAAIRDAAPRLPESQAEDAPILLAGGARGSDQLGAHFFGLALQMGAASQPGGERRVPRVLVQTHDFAVGSLDAVFTRVDARAIVLVAATEPSDAGVVERYVASGNPAPLILVGAGWSPEDAGPGRYVMRTYAGAVYEVLATVGG